MKKSKKEHKKNQNHDGNKSKNQQTTSPSENHDYQMDSKPTMWEIISPEGMKIDSEDHGIIKQSLGTKTYFRPM
jgi:hypothetical protein